MLSSLLCNQVLNCKYPLQRYPVFEQFCNKFTDNFVLTYTFIFCLFSSDTLEVLMFFILLFKCFAYMNVVTLFLSNFSVNQNYSIWIHNSNEENNVTLTGSCIVFAFITVFLFVYQYYQKKTNQSFMSNTFWAFVELL